MSSAEGRVVDLTQTTPPSTPTSRRSPSPSSTSALNTQKTKTKEDTMVKDSTAKKKKKKASENNSETENTEITVDPRTLCKQEMVVGNREDLKTLQE